MHWHESNDQSEESHSDVSMIQAMLHQEEKPNVFDEYQLEITMFEPENNDSQEFEEFVWGPNYEWR